MSDQDKSQKTEAASKRKLEKAREQGQVAKSQDLASAAALTIAVIMIASSADFFAKSFTEFFISSARDFPMQELSDQGLMSVMYYYAKIFLILGMPVIGVIWLTSLLATLVQVGLKFSLKPLEPSMEKINPISGFKRLMSVRSLVRTGLALIKMLAIAAIAVSIFVSSQDEIARLALQEQSIMLGVIGSIAWEIGIKAAGALLILALIDYAYQRWQFLEDQKMSKREVKEEYKQQEGDPHIKGKVRSRQRATATKRGLQESVEAADVVVTNPFHIAVAIKYDRNSPEAAPHVVAKGARLLAQRIKDFAKEADIEIIQNIPLARALYKECKVDMEIPPEFYVAVAEVLAIVYSKRKNSNN